MENQSRRGFLKTATLTAAVTTVGAHSTAEAAVQKAKINQGAVFLTYPSTAVTKSRGMQLHTPVSFNYPDAGSPCVAIKMENATAGGVGPEGNIVAFSILCSHMGCPVAFDALSKTFKCPCHYSVFDPENKGQMVCGHATENLPQIDLRYDAITDSLSAIGVSGLIYGRQANIL
jgi:arsenite oxidase small subunit